MPAALMILPARRGANELAKYMMVHPAAWTALPRIRVRRLPKNSVRGEVNRVKSIRHRLVRLAEIK